VIEYGYFQYLNLHRISCPPLKGVSFLRLAFYGTEIWYGKRAASSAKQLKGRTRKNEKEGNSPISLQFAYVWKPVLPLPDFARASNKAKAQKSLL
jgi:hypothetical protein